MKIDFRKVTTIKRPWNVFMCSDECDESYKKELINLGESYQGIICKTDDEINIDDNKSNEELIEIISSKHLIDTNITIILVGTKTKHSRLIDLIARASMHNGSIHARSAIVTLILPSIEKVINKEEEMLEYIPSSIVDDKVWVNTVYEELVGDREYPHVFLDHLKYLLETAEHNWSKVHSQKK